MARRASLAALLVVAVAGLGLVSTAHAWTATGGGDYGGGNWHITTNTLVGGHTYDVGTFTIDAGVTVSVVQWTAASGASDTSGYFWVEANNITVNGTIDAQGRGAGGGGGAWDYCGTGYHGLPGLGGLSGSGGNGGNGGNPPHRHLRFRRRRWQPQRTGRSRRFRTRTTVIPASLGPFLPVEMVETGKTAMPEARAAQRSAAAVAAAPAATITRKCAPAAAVAEGQAAQTVVRELPDLVALAATPLGTRMAAAPLQAQPARRAGITLPMATLTLRPISRLLRGGGGGGGGVTSNERSWGGGGGGGAGGGMIALDGTSILIGSTAIVRASGAPGGTGGAD